MGFVRALLILLSVLLLAKVDKNATFFVAGFMFFSLLLLDYVKMIKRPLDNYEMKVGYIGAIPCGIWTCFSLIGLIDIIDIKEGSYIILESELAGTLLISGGLPIHWFIYGLIISTIPGAAMEIFIKPKIVVKEDGKAVLKSTNEVLKSYTENNSRQKKSSKETNPVGMEPQAQITK
jgi:hypothetical protein